MEKRRRRLGVSAVGAVMATVMVVSGVMVIVYSMDNPDELAWFQVVALFYFYVPLAAFAAIGLAIVRRQRRNVIGWIMVAFGAGGIVPILAGAYTLHVLPGREWLVWMAVVQSMSVWGLVALMLLLFPTGAPPSPRWALFAWLVVFFMAAVTVVGAVAPWEYAAEPSLFVASNPIGWAGDPWPPEQVDGLSFSGTLLLLASLVSLVPRWRRAGRDERQQLKWLGQAGLIFGIIILVAILEGAFVGFDEETAASYLVGNGLFMMAVTTLALAVGFAVSRYRLYDVDRIINRTLVYLLATLAIAVMFGGLVLIPLTFFADTSGAPAAGVVLVGVATLAIAAAFNPLRSRVQRVVDRRFDRARYDANRVVAEFRERLKEPRDLDSLVDEVSTVIARTMAPSGFGVWTSKGNER